MNWVKLGLTADLSFVNDGINADFSKGVAAVPAAAPPPLASQSGGTALVRPPGPSGNTAGPQADHTPPALIHGFPKHADVVQNGLLGAGLGAAAGGVYSALRPAHKRRPLASMLAGAGLGGALGAGGTLLHEHLQGPIDGHASAGDATSTEVHDQAGGAAAMGGPAAGPGQKQGPAAGAPQGYQPTTLGSMGKAMGDNPWATAGLAAGGTGLALVPRVLPGGGRLSGLGRGTAGIGSFLGTAGVGIANRYGVFGKDNQQAIDDGTGAAYNAQALWHGLAKRAPIGATIADAIGTPAMIGQEMGTYGLPLDAALQSHAQKMQGRDLHDAHAISDVAAHPTAAGMSALNMGTRFLNPVSNTASMVGNTKEIGDALGRHAADADAQQYIGHTQQTRANRLQAKGMPTADVSKDRLGHRGSWWDRLKDGPWNWVEDLAFDHLDERRNQGAAEARGRSP